MRSRIKVIFIKATVLDGHRWVVGNFGQFRTEKANKLITQKIAKEYNGQWPPKKNKTKINLKDLR